MTRVLYSYERLGDVALDVVEARRDGVLIPIGNEARDAKQIWLLAEDEQQSHWSTLDMQVAVRLQPSEVARLEEARLTQLSVSAVARCARSELRQSNLLDRSSVDPARWTGRLSWDRRFVAGNGELRAVVSATGDGFDDRLVGASPSWAIHFDAVEPFPTKGPIDVRWADFAAERPAIPELSDFTSERFYLDLDDDHPTLFLNKGLEYLPALLKDRRRRGTQRALHEVVSVEIATKTRIALIDAAIARVDLDEEEPDWPEVPWQRNILEELFDEMPERFGGSGLRTIADADESAEVRRQLSQAIVATVEDQLSAGAITRRACGIVLDSDDDGGA